MGGREGQFDLSIGIFQKKNLPKRSKALLLLSFYIITSHIIPENFNEIPQGVQKILTTLTNVNYFYQLIWFFDIFLLEQN